MNASTVAIVGSGLIGRAWATIFARAGWNVRLNDPHIPTLKSAPRLIRDELHALALSDTTVALERGRVIHQGPSKALRDDLDLRRKVLWL